MRIVDVDSGFADWLRAAMLAAKISQRQLGYRSGVDHATISRLLAGQRAPLLATADRLARALDVALTIGAGR